MLNEFLQELMGVHSIPAHSHILSTLSLSNGGLGLQHPRLAAIPSFMLTIKRAINFAIKGVHLPFTPSAIQLPASLTKLYSNWDSENTTCRTFQAFQLYLPSITATIINDDPTATDSLSRADFDKFLHRTSFPWARETLRHHASEQYLFHLLEASPNDVLHAIPGMLQQHMSLPLVSMSRSNIKNRLDNKSFDIALKSKLRIPIYNESSRPVCFCGTRIDCHADHYFSCGEYKKTRCSNKFRDTTKFVMKRICPTAQYCNSANNVERELTNRVKETASKRPFDWSFVINHIKAAELKGSSPLSEIGFDAQSSLQVHLTTFKRMLAHLIIVFRFLRREKGRSLREKALILTNPLASLYLVTNLLANCMTPTRVSSHNLWTDGEIWAPSSNAS